MTYRRAGRIGVIVGAVLVVAGIALRSIDRAFLDNYEGLSNLTSYVEWGIFPGLVLIDIGPFMGVGVMGGFALGIVGNLVLFGGLGCLSLLICRCVAAVSRTV